MNCNELRRLAGMFRRAIEKCDRGKLGVGFQYFPAGACGDASLILAEFLRRNGAADVRYASGVRRRGADRQSHAWLVVGGYIVDITANQFDEIEEQILITRDPTWHATFSGDDYELGAGDYRTWDDHTAHQMAALYALVAREIEA